MSEVSCFWTNVQLASLIWHLGCSAWFTQGILGNRWIELGCTSLVGRDFHLPLTTLQARIGARPVRSAVYLQAVCGMDSP